MGISSSFDQPIRVEAFSVDLKGLQQVDNQGHLSTQLYNTKLIPT